MEKGYSSITTVRSFLPETGQIRIEAIVGDSQGKALVNQVRTEETYGVAQLMAAHVNIIGEQYVTPGEYSYQLVN